MIEWKIIHTPRRYYYGTFHERKEQRKMRRQNKMLTTVEDIMNYVDLATEPSVMNKQKAIEFLEQCSTGLDSRIEALKDELRNEEE